MVSFYQAVFNVTISNVNVSNAMQILRLDPQRMHQDFRVQEIIRIGILTVFIHRIFIARNFMYVFHQSEDLPSYLVGRISKVIRACLKLGD